MRQRAPRRFDITGNGREALLIKIESRLGLTVINLFGLSAITGPDRRPVAGALVSVIDRPEMTTPARDASRGG
jgi:hypothetical protein